MWYKFVNNELSHFFKSMFVYSLEPYKTETRSHGMFHLYPTRTAGACNVVRHHVPNLLVEFTAHLTGEVRANSIGTFFAHIKSYLISSNSHECTQIKYYIRQRNS